jgi:hypothetical protein
MVLPFSGVVVCSSASPWSATSIAPDCIGTCPDGLTYRLIFTDANITIPGNSVMYGPSDFVSTAHDVLTIMFYSGAWYEIGRSVNQ